MPKTDLIGSLEASTILGVHRGAFNKQCAEGKIPVHTTMPGKVGQRLFLREDILALADKSDLAACMARHPAGSDLTA